MPPWNSRVDPTSPSGRRPRPTGFPTTISPCLARSITDRRSRGTPFIPRHSERRQRRHPEAHAPACRAVRGVPRTGLILAPFLLRRRGHVTCACSRPGRRGSIFPRLVIYHYIAEQRLTQEYYRSWCFWRGVSRGMMDRRHPWPSPTWSAFPVFSGALRPGGSAARRLVQATPIEGFLQKTNFVCGTWPATFTAATSIRWPAFPPFEAAGVTTISRPIHAHRTG